MKKRIIHYAEILYPGILFPEESIRKITKRDRLNPIKYSKTLDKRVFAFSFMHRTEIKDGKDTLYGKWEGQTPYWYFGKLYTAQEIKSSFRGSEYKILRANIEINDYTSLVRCRTGNWRPIGVGDTVIHAD